MPRICSTFDPILKFPLLAVKDSQNIRGNYSRQIFVDKEVLFGDKPVGHHCEDGIQLDVKKYL